MLEADVEDRTALGMLGIVYQSMECYAEAYHLNKLAADRGPPNSVFCNNVALAAIGLDRHDEAERWLRKAIKLDPVNADAMSNMAVLMMKQSRPDETILWADKALSINPDSREAQENRGYACLMLKRWAEGWEGYEAMVGRKMRPNLYPDIPYWDGARGKRLLVSGEQGLGDEISFASILPDVDTDMVFDCDPRLEGLFRRSFPDLEIHGTRFERGADWRHGFDAHCLIGSLAWHYRSKGEFPGRPFLVADPERRTQWKALLDQLPGLRVGVAWTGGLPSTFRSRRSLSLETLAPLLKTPGVSWVSLQYLDPREEIAEFTAKHGVEIKHWARAAEAVNYDETAALVAELDLVICVTTAAVDLAGALGVPCWVLVPAKPHWRYGMEGESKVWYESVKLFRQKKDWPIEQVRGELAKYLCRRGPQAAISGNGLAKLDHSPFIRASEHYLADAGSTASQA